MKMLFFSVDATEVQEVGESFQTAGIHCEIRRTSSLGHAGRHPPETELWICDERDCHRAFMLCVRQCVGFAKRPPTPSIFDLDDDPREEAVEFERRGFARQQMARA
jgi:hypothetical protein